jgi:hypothetical protein
MNDRLLIRVAAMRRAIDIPKDHEGEISFDWSVYL